MVKPKEDKVNPSGSERLMKVKEACEMLAVKSRTIYRMIAAGELHPVKRGRSTYFLASEIEAFIEKLKSQRGYA